MIRIPEQRESLEESVRAVLAGNGGTMGAVANGLARMGLGKSVPTACPCGVPGCSGTGSVA